MPGWRLLVLELLLRAAAGAGITAAAAATLAVNGARRAACCLYTHLVHIQCRVVSCKEPDLTVCQPGPATTHAVDICGHISPRVQVTVVHLLAVTGVTQSEVGQGAKRLPSGGMLLNDCASGVAAHGDKSVLALGGRAQRVPA